MEEYEDRMRGGGAISLPLFSSFLFYSVPSALASFAKRNVRKLCGDTDTIGGIMKNRDQIFLSTVPSLHFILQFDHMPLFAVPSLWFLVYLNWVILLIIISVINRGCLI